MSRAQRNSEKLFLTLDTGFKEDSVLRYGKCKLRTFLKTVFKFNLISIPFFNFVLIRPDFLMSSIYVKPLRFLLCPHKSFRSIKIKSFF